MSLSTDVKQLVMKTAVPAREVAARTQAIYESTLGASPYLDAGNFTRLHASDLKRLFDRYDATFFDGAIRSLLGDSPLSFRLSKRMTSAAGKASFKQWRSAADQPPRIEYEIAVSTTLLFQTFQDQQQRDVRMSGIPCRDRLQALQRVLEHETVHLLEMLLWRQSSCSAARFQGIAHRFFAHTEHRHQLITPRERALTEYGIRTGDRVTFRFERRHYVGTVNRITKRATVLVEDERGEPYSDGKRYAKFYVPLSLLKPAAT